MSTGFPVTVVEIAVIVLASMIFSFSVTTILRGVCIAVYHAVEIIKNLWFRR